MVDLLVDKLGKHRTGAAAYAARLSDSSRVAITPMPDGTSAYESIKHHKSRDGLRVRGASIPEGVIAFAYGHFRTTVSRAANILTITVNDRFNDFTHQIGNIDAESLRVMSFDPISDDTLSLIQDVNNGESISFLSGGTFIDNRSSDVVVRFVLYPIAKGQIYKFPRDGVSRIIGMTYSDARQFMIPQRVNVFGEEESIAKSAIEEQTHQQLPTNHERNNIGKAEIYSTDFFPDGTGPSSPNDFNFRMVSIGKRLAININENTEEDLLYVSKDTSAIRTFDQLRDAYGFEIGPNEASQAELVYSGLVVDGKKIPNEHDHVTINGILSTKFASVNDNCLEDYLNTYVDVVNRTDSSFIKGITNLTSARAAVTGSGVEETNDNILTTLNKVSLGNVVCRIELATAFGEVISYSRKGTAQRFLNAVKGNQGGFNTQDGLINKFNEVALNISSSTIFDNTTGVFSPFSKSLTPSGLEFTDGSVFKMVGYRKTYSDIGDFRSRQSVINWIFELDLSNIVYQDISYNQENLNRQYDKIRELIDNSIDFLKMNVNFWVQSIVAAAWDNIALPLTNADLFIIDGDDPIRMDRNELFVTQGIESDDGEFFYEARFTANGDRISFGVPDIFDLIEEDGLEPKAGYKVKKFSNVNGTHFLVVEEDNDVASDVVYRYYPPTSPNLVVNKAVNDGEVSILRTDFGLNIQEPDYMNLEFSVQDRGINRKPLGHLIPARTSFSQMGDYVNDLYKELYAQSQSILSAPGYTFTGIVVDINDISYFNVKPDGSNTVVRCQKLDGSASISKDDRVLVFERERGKYSAIRLPFTSESAETVTMYPEYSNAAETTGEVNNTANNSVTSTFVVSGNTNFYRFSTSSPTAQDLSISVIIPIPAGIVELREVTLENKLSGVADAEIKVQVIDSDGVSDRNIDIPKNTTLNEYKIGGFSGTYTPGGIFRIVITGFCTSAETADIGKLVAKLR